ncbi:helix-turn-helix transcriptional regulator [Nocardia sp. NRRL S-836]|uniref:helix-turn-helix transcriptional regulator n=1 Tax=Nocardia sp. NRRL S-836 TaxID=1519492 RepID=UPI0018D101D7|nr:helix-turn-helix transcriptional regulator [Nocardia sp. NRRL S-836]
MGRVIKAYRRHEVFLKLIGRSLTQEEFGRWFGLQQGSVSRIERGKPETNIDMLRTIAKGLHLPEDLLWFDFPGRNRADEALKDKAADGRTGVGSSSEFVWESPSAIAERASSFASATGETMIELVNTAITDVISRYESEGPKRLAAEALKIRTTVQHVLDGWIHPTRRDAVTRLAAQASALLGYMAVNAGKFNVATAYCTEGEALAAAANDTDLRIWVRGTRSFCAYYEKDYAAAAEIARAGIALNPSSPQVVRLRSNGEARALGKLGRRDEAGAAIDSGMRLLESLGTDTKILSPCISFSPYDYPRFAVNAATAWVPLGHLGHVVRYVTESDAAVEEADSAWSRVLTRLDMATAAILRNPPDLERAVLWGTAALRVSGASPVQSILQRAATLRRAATRWTKAPVVHDFVEAYEAWTKSTTP